MAFVHRAFEQLALAGPTTGPHWAVLAVAAAATLACVGLHYETIRLLVVMTHRGKIRRVRSLLILVVLILFVAHLIEASIFAGAYHLLFAMHDSAIGELTGAYDGGFPDSLYFSLSVYTTVGFGDIAPVGPIRLLVGIEALAGLVLITWSASFTFLIMQRIFARDYHDDA
ncbi:MAG: potassium channel family protein [Phycisphaeraceae bacterium]